MIVVGYLRVSSQEQKDSGISLAAQRKRIEAFAVAHGLTLEAIHEDAGLSGGTLDRPGLTAALAAVKRGAGLVVVKLDRLSRDVVGQTQLVNKYFKTGKRKLYAIDSSVDVTTATGRGAAQMHAVFASMEREAGGERTKAALTELKESGKRYTRILPFGKRLADDGETLVTDEREAAVVAEARALRSKGLALRAVAETLASRGVLSRAGKVFGAQSIADMCAAA